MRTFTKLKSFLKRKTSTIIIVATLFCFGGVMTACSGPKSGCPINEETKGRTNRKGELSNKKGKSNLFPKKVRKKMRTK